MKEAKSVSCSIHGTHGIGLVCVHVANGLLRGDQVGFYWSDNTDLARPDAWCKDCETALRHPNDTSSEVWLANADFKMLCALCWDEAKAVCGGFKQ
jgi:hypothetical protein